MRKFEELIDLINTKHPEWKNLTVRSLKDISGYSHDASRLALLTLKPNIDQTPKQKTIKKTKSIPPQDTAQEHQFIDDPNELLMSVSKRELNKPDPEVRWASILLQLLDKTKQLEAKSKSELQSKLKSYSTTELIELRKKLIES